MNSTVKRPTLLCILDGYGLNPNPKANAVHLARKKTLDYVAAHSPSETLSTHGPRVGLPEGHMGNSEVGHLNIGAGRVVKQWLYRITEELQSGFLESSQVFHDFLKNLPNGSTIHLVGLYSYGGVHSHAEHLQALLDALRRVGRHNIALHLITDGRDTAPRAALKDLSQLEVLLTSFPEVRIASISGRFYAMDRDNRWERVEKAFAAIARADAPRYPSLGEYISQRYASGETDEFLEPGVITPLSVAPQDGVIFWNFRADRMREISAAFTEREFHHFNRNWTPVTNALSFTGYDEKLTLPFLFSHEPIDNHLGQVISMRGLKQFRTAETEKYPHVTYFLSGGSEEPLPGEDRRLVPSPRDVKTYDLKPEMSAHAVKDGVIEAIQSGKYDLIIVNFANCDMVGHTGVLSAAIKAVETVDGCLAEILPALEKAGGQALIIADHGNAEQMINYETGEPHTAHTTFPVPVYLIGYSEPVTLRPGGALCDVAPTLLDMMGIPQPAEMTGVSLIQGG